MFSCSVSCSVSVGLARSKEAVRGRVSCSVSVGLARSKEAVGGRYMFFFFKMPLNAFNRMLFFRLWLHLKDRLLIAKVLYLMISTV